MSNKLRGFFRYHRSERPGIIILLGCILILLFYRQYAKPSAAPVNFSQTEIDSIWNEIDSIDALASKVSSPAKATKAKVEKLKRFEFNPNTNKKEDWLKLGFSPKQATSILKYRKAGGEFRIKSDLLKMYVVSEEKYQSLYSFIDLPDSLVEKQSDLIKTKAIKKPKFIVNLNDSDTNDWKKLRGVGPVYAKRIIDFREALGGFYQVEQLKEVYGLDDSLILSFREQIIIDTVQLSQLNINTYNAEALKNHPYLNWNLANAIVAYREQHGRYNRIEDLKKLVLIDDSLYRKLSYYLTID